MENWILGVCVAALSVVGSIIGAAIVAIKIHREPSRRRSVAERIKKVLSVTTDAGDLKSGADMGFRRPEYKSAFEACLNHELDLMRHQLDQLEAIQRNNVHLYERMLADLDKIGEEIYELEREVMESARLVSPGLENDRGTKQPTSQPRVR